jgi:voltage-gated potassium channel
MRKLIELFLSPTYFYANFRKQIAQEAGGKKARGDLIRKYNQRYFVVAIIMATALAITHQWNNYPMDAYNPIYSLVIGTLIWIFPLSRANEIFYAFYKDAIDKVGKHNQQSDVTPAERIKLALTSYGELVIDFAIIYYLLPVDWFSKPLNSIFDSIYFSGVTIATIGYGDYSPTHVIPKLLVVYEVFCGFMLLIVSFAIYTGRGLEDRKTDA